LTQTGLRGNGKIHHPASVIKYSVSM